jgi:hypothetical protein
MRGGELFFSFYFIFFFPGESLKKRKNIVMIFFKKINLDLFFSLRVIIGSYIAMILCLFHNL